MIDTQTVVDTATEALKTQDGESIRAGVWATAGAVSLGVLSFLGAIVANWRGWRETASAGRTADFRRLREEIERRDTDMDEMRAEMRTLRAEVTESGRQCADMQLKMVRMQTAFSLVSSELYRHDPENVTLKQARDLVAGISISDEAVFRSGITSLSTPTKR